MDKVHVTKDLENKILTIERSFDAPKEKLWKAYADKQWFTRWWGPEGWETTVKEFDFVPGGKIHYGMKCVDENQGEWFGKESWGLMVLESIDEPTSFSAKDYFSDVDGVVDPTLPAQKFTVELIEEGDKTRLVTRSITDSAEQLEQLVAMGMIEGFSSQLNKLEKLLGE
ncbi:MAG: SRPBCC domain-containing protein [Patescibacteria group bacterium]